MLYKYLAREHFDSLIAFGSIKIGTLHGYRDDEAGEMVSDTMEGSKRFSGGYSKMTKGIARKSKSLSRMVNLAEGVEVDYLFLMDCTIKEPNYFIFSASNMYSEEEHRRWQESQGYDTCYRINFPNTFFRNVTRALDAAVPVEFLGIFRVQYYDEKCGMDWFDQRESLPAFLLKDSADFSDQSEVRAVWRPRSTADIQPKIISADSLRNYVNLHRSLSM